MLMARDVDDLLAECVEELPGWVLERLGDCVIRVEAMPRTWPIEPTPAPHHDLPRARCWRTPRRAPSCGASTRAELLRLVVERLELEAAQAVELAEACL